MSDSLSSAKWTTTPLYSPPLSTSRSGRSASKMAAMSNPSSSWILASAFSRASWSRGERRRPVFSSQRRAQSTKNAFLPLPDYSVHADIIYICSPNNPTGAVYNREQLSKWIDYAIKNSAIILFDAAYESFVDNATLPKSIYEIENAKKCAIEFCSLSKTAGFTGTRCGYTIVPNELNFDGMNLNKMWLRRQTTKYNGVPYIVQKGAQAVFSELGQKQIRENLNYYKRNAKVISDTLDKINIKYTGGKNSPYIWLKCPNNMNSWDFFDLLLTKIGVVGTPGAGFGKNGNNWFRLTSFNTLEKTQEAMERFSQLFK